MEPVIYIKAPREGYSVDQIKRTLTVGQLIDLLEGYDESTKVYLQHDEGYTYGGLTYDSIIEKEEV